MVNSSPVVSRKKPQASKFKTAPQSAKPGRRGVVAAGGLEASSAGLSPAEIETIVSGWTKRARAAAEAMAQPIASMLECGDNKAAMAALLHLLTEQNVELERAEMRLGLARRLRFGSSSERLSRGDLEQMFLAFGGQPEADGSMPEELTLEPPDPNSDRCRADAKRV